ncbi:MAG: type II secretion system F family protein [Alphaproteobacteria bacterium]|nr:type II secretion system F family protein [Alphaproteobacteria bacterium]
MNRLELSYARLVFRMNTNKRMSVARKLASLLRNDFTLMDALGRIERIESNGGKNPHEPFAIVMRQWQKNLERGMSFSDATRGWMAPNETLLLTSGNISSLVVALENLERMVGGIGRIRRAFMGAVAYPLFLFALTIAIIIMVGIYLVPPLAAVAGNNIAWRGVAASLVWVSNFAGAYWYIIAIGFVTLVLIIAFSLPNWSGKMRARFDDLPPWNIYKIQESVGWLTGLAALVAAGITLPDAMRMLADNSNRYLRSILDATLRRIANGENLGSALNGTGRGFPNSEIIGDLEIYADMTDFDQNLTRIANDYLDESVRKMDAVSSALNNIGIILVSLIIAWVIFGTFQMQDQITAMFN